MKRLCAMLLLCGAAASAAADKTLVEAIDEARNPAICIPAMTYYQAAGTIFSQILRIGVLERQLRDQAARIAELQQRLAAAGLDPR